MPSVPPPTAVQSEPPTEPPSDDAPWPLWTAPAALVAGLALGYTLVAIVAIVANGSGASLSHPPPAVTITGNVLFDLAFVAAGLYFTRLQGDRPRAADFGFRRISLRLGVSAFLVAGVAYYALSFAYAAIFNLKGSEKLPKDLGVDKSTVAAVAATVFVCVIAPIAEEFFFRGFLFGVLRRWRVVVAGREIGVWLAAAITAILFGLAHTGSAAPQYLVPLAVLGFILALVRWRTGSLYPCMALHSVNNALAMGINQFRWTVGGVLALIAGSLLVIGAITGPLAAPLRVPARA
jgi:membrane protease YdiL (CAAX protease family)